MGWLVFSNLFVACCGALLTVATYPLLGQPPRVDAGVLLVFCGTLVVYNLDRLVEPRPGDTPHEQWVARHRPALWLLTALAAIGCFAALPFLAPRVIGSLAIAAALSIGYCVPVYRRAGQWRRLKALPGAKLLLIVGVWTYATTLIPLLNRPIVVELDQITLVTAARLLFIFAVALPFDVPDMARDRAARITTLPQRIGFSGTRNLALGLAGGFALLAALNPWPFAAALLVSAAVTVFLLASLGPRRGVVYYEVLLDGLLLVQAGLLLLLWAGMGRVV